MEPATALHVESFLIPLQPTRGVAAASRAIGTAASQDTAIRRDFDAIRRWLAKPRPEKTSKELVDLLLPVAYLRAQEALRSADLSSVQAVRDRMRRARATVETLEPDFLTALATETRERAKNADFARSL